MVLPELWMAIPEPTFPRVASDTVVPILLRDTRLLLELAKIEMPFDLLAEITFCESVFEPPICTFVAPEVSETPLSVLPRGVVPLDATPIKLPTTKPPVVPA